MQHTNAKAFSAIELLTVTACIGLLVAAGLPAWQQSRATRQLIQATELFAGDLRNTRRLTLLHDRSFYLHFDTAALHSIDGDDWCYVMATDTNCHCLGISVPPACQALPDRQRHWQQAADFPGIHLSEAVFGSHNYIVFNPVRGTASFGHLRLEDEYNHVLIINVSLLGRIRICRPAAALVIGHYPPC